MRAPRRRRQRMWCEAAAPWQLCV